MKYLYRAYQLCIALPLVVVVTIIIATSIVIGCSLGFGHFWGYYPGPGGPVSSCGCCSFP